MKTFALKLARAMVIHGGVVRAGTTVELDEATAKDFLRRGKAELAHGAQAPGNDKADAAEFDLSKLNKTQLVDLAQQLGVLSVSDAMTKAEIVAAIEAASEAQAA